MSKRVFGIIDDALHSSIKEVDKNSPVGEALQNMRESYRKDKFEDDSDE